MPTWRARGAQPRSVTLRVAASSAPSRAASGLSSSYSSGVTPVPTPMTTGARASVSTSSSRRSASTRTRPRVPIARVTHGDIARSAAAGARQDARAHGDHLRGAAARDVGHQCAGERGLGRHQDAVACGQRDGIAHQSRARGGRGAAGHLAAERRARGEHGPRRRLPHGGGERIGHVLGDRGAAQHEHEVGPRRPQRAASTAPHGAASAAVRAEHVDGRAHLAAEARRGAEELLGHP